MTYLVLSLPWLAFYALLSRYWGSDPEYYFGFVVPLLSAYAFLEKTEQVQTGKPSKLSYLPVVIGLTITVMAAWLLLANPYWNRIGWLLGLACILTTWGTLASMGGWKFSTLFWFPLIFPLISMPWPTRVVMNVVVPLKCWVASVAASLTSMLGTPAVATGSYIEVGTGMVSIDTACSGIRALQTVLMLSLFLGELRNLSLLRRGIFCFVAAIIAVAVNVCRTTVLVWAMAKGGHAQVAAWHDTAANLDLVVSIGLVILLGLYFNPSKASAVSAKLRVSRGTVFTYVGFLVVGVSLIFWWYRPLKGVTTWSIQPPSNWEKVSVPDFATNMLKYTEAKCYASSGENKLLVYLFRWKGDVSTRYYAGSHSPAVCLSMMGAKVTKEYGLRKLRLGDKLWDMQSFSFDGSKGSFYVFLGLWDENAGISMSAPAGWDFDGNRWKQVWSRQNKSQTVQLTIAINNCVSLEEAIKKVEAGNWLTLASP